MKTAAFILTLILASCAPTPPEWDGKPDPLDTPAVESIEPTANGHWGPFGTAPAAHRNFNGSP